MMKWVAGILSVILLPACKMLSEEGVDIGEQEYASAASGITITPLARGTYAPYKVKSEGAVEYKAKTEAATDIVVRQHSYAAHSFTGWHAHPGPVFITVVQG